MRCLEVCKQCYWYKYYAGHLDAGWEKERGLTTGWGSQWRCASSLCADDECRFILEHNLIEWSKS